MKKILLGLIFAFSINVALCQSVVIQSISNASQVIGSSVNNLKSYLKSSQYVFLKEYNNMHTYYKSFEGVTYTLTVAIRNDKVSALSWEELSSNSSYFSNELNNLGFVMTNSSVLGNQEVRSYQNLKRNLMVTLIFREGIIKLTMGIKDFNIPYNTKVYSSSKSANNNHAIVSITLSPKDNDSRIFSKPNSKFLHPDFTDGNIGLFWTFKAKKKIVTSQGTYFLGDILTPRGAAQPNGPYYILASEWNRL